MPTVTIDNKAVQVPNGTLVVEAARQVGVEIPVFCYHPTLQPVGMCRMCLVEVGTPKRGKDGQIEKGPDGNAVIGWMPKLQTACTTVISDGMSVRTDTSQVAEARRAVLEFLLTSHPLDCPICDKGGECPLQNLTMAYGPGQSRFPVDSKFHTEKRVPLGDLIVLDRERCIQCSRCIRFQDEIADDHVLGFQKRGRALQITTLSDPPFDSKFSGNTVDICPVGALTSRDFRLSARVWEIHDQSSVCPHCSVGCNILIGERDHEIKRIVPRENDAVNGIWLCDKGRFGHHFVAAPGRLSTPLIRRDGKLEPARWSQALDVISSRFAEIREQHGSHALGGLAGDRVSNEDLYVFQKIFRQVIGSPNVEHRVGWSASNMGAALVLKYGAGAATNLGALDKNVTVLLLGADPEEEQPVIRLRLTHSVRNNGANLIVANGRLTKAAKYAKQSLVYRYGSEAWFVYGLVRAVLDDQLASKEFVQARVTNFAEFADGLGTLTVDSCADKCGLSADALRQAARALAQSPDALIMFGREFMFAQTQDCAVARAIEALALVTGHVGRKNNGLIALYPHNNSTGAIDFGVMSDSGVSRTSVAEPGLTATDLANGTVSGLYVMACDPAGEIKFVKPEFLVVQDLFLTKTAEQADVVLPAQAFAEREGTFTNTERRVQLYRPSTKPPGESKPDWWVITEVAKRLGANWSYSSPGQIMDEIAATVPLYAGMSYSALAENVLTPREAFGLGNPSHAPAEIAMGKLENTSSGKAWSSGAEKDAQSKFELEWVEPRSIEPLARFYLASARSLYDCGTMIGKTELVQSRVPDPFVEMNSHDAEELGIGNGVRVQVMTNSCRIDATARVDGHVPPGVVLIPANLEGTIGMRMGVPVRVVKI